MGVLRHRRLSAALAVFIFAAVLGESAEECIGGNRAGNGRHKASASGTGASGGGSEAPPRTRVVAADMPGSLRPLLPLPAGPRGHPSWPEPPTRVLPGGMAMQMRQQPLHALRPRQNPQKEKWRMAKATDFHHHR
ncbi:hypothetical protein B296_00041692 [Ensete ventricosum]|uniref:Uncharacterized protein n=1 Tax=Ensete ventricosum TaxID=4639 RepID=A0A426XBB6_ENSVE|nr:hypothetical protein B296_00041692 [Ensete ventricosum]